MAENVRADAFIRDARTFTNTLEEQADAIFRQRQSRLGEKQVIFSCTAPFGQFLLTGSMVIQIVQKITQAVVAERDASLLGTFPLDDQEAAFAVKITQTQITELAKPDAGIIEEPQDSAIPGGCTIGEWSNLAWRCAGQQELFKLLGLYGPTEFPIVILARRLARRSCCSRFPFFFEVGADLSAARRRDSAWASSLARCAAARASVTFFDGFVGCCDSICFPLSPFWQVASKQR